MSEFDAAALELVTEFGTTGTYVKVTKGAYNPATGEQEITSQNIPVRVVIMDLTLQSNGLSTKYGTSIIAGDKEAHMIPPQKLGGPAITVDPVVDKLIVAGVEYSIATFKEVNMTGTNPILYSLYLRR